MIEVIKGATQKPVSSDALINFFSRNQEIRGQMYIGYPIFSTPEGKFPIDAILIIPNKGIILINLVEGKILPEDYENQQDDAYNKLEAKLRNYKMLVQKRTLAIQIATATYAPAISRLPANDEYPVCNDSNLLAIIQKLPEANSDYYRKTLSALQSISTLRNNIKKREISNQNSRGAKLMTLEESIANLDMQQGRAVIETVDDVQRIRGLAGSGKTIVLALKAAYLHAKNPDWKIAVTFQTRALKAQFRRLIRGFLIEQTGEEPNWNNLKVIHAWGSGIGEDEGVYYNFCKYNQILPLDFRAAKRKFNEGREFGGSCEEALSSVPVSMKLFDAILIDEAQDFPIEFLRLCYHILGDKKRLVYAYDELQSLTSQSLPSPEILFGNNDQGRPLVSLSKRSQDIILEKCYRNSKPVLTTAHALGFGIYREPDAKTGTGLIQMFDNKRLWEDVGYSVISGQIEDNEAVVLERSDESSPIFLSDHSSIDDLIMFKKFQTEEEQNNWLIEQLKKNITADELRCDDIIVINTEPLSTKRVVGPIRAHLFQQGVNTHLVGVDTEPDVFFRTGQESIAFTGIFRAKGNEAGMVYVINAQDCYKSFGNLATVRNRLFTAITRSKAWVRVLGVGNDMEKLIQEFDAVKRNNFQLSFTYPSAQLRQKLNIVNRDMSAIEKKKIRDADKNLGTLLDDINNAKLTLDDIDPRKLEKLRQLLSESGE